MPRKAKRKIPSYWTYYVGGGTGCPNKEYKAFCEWWAVQCGLGRFTVGKQEELSREFYRLYRSKQQQ